MDSSTFLRTLLATEPRKLRSLWKTQPDKGALKHLMRLMEGAETPSERFARKALCELWGIHGQHQPGTALMQTLGGLPNERHALLTTSRDRLTQRLREALSRAEGPTDYARLFEDLRYFGPGVQRRWTLDTLRKDNEP